MRPLALLARILGGLVAGVAGCATATGTPVASDAAVDATTEGGDALFPLDDSGGDVTPDTAATPDTGTSPDTAVDTGPACGAVGEPCCGTTCAAGGYCQGGACWANPKLVCSSPDGSHGGADCANLSAIHLSPSYLEKVVITGRPGAIAYRYYRKTSCGETVGKLVPEGPATLDATGVYVYVIENGVAYPECTNGNLGVYESWVVVDGIESAHVFNRIYSSGCATYATCASVDKACP